MGLASWRSVARGRCERATFTLRFTPVQVEAARRRRPRELVLRHHVGGLRAKWTQASVIAAFGGVHEVVRDDKGSRQTMEIRA